MKKKVMTAALSTAIVLDTLGTGGIVGVAPSTTPTFPDIQNSFAKEAIQQLIDLGIIKGVDASHFDPKGHLTHSRAIRYDHG
ncbi:S-layer homology domain-containing protein [Paenibacillus albus]|uniref:S-layer homology domain-containing protein n=1 Tax=Paenibacillus albus TaxID=2495582 RepID=A0A3Q8X3F8_9BACL|nr:S-layer homology domain-containing protein [Paenibacillus albus]AZN39568.1 S-layer homology domain-containing protein [Paenibacillus albus]